MPGDQPTDGVNTFLPPGVAASGEPPDGTVAYLMDPFLRDMRWPGLTVASSAFKELPVQERFYRQARAFLRASLVICEDAGSAGTALEWSQGAVCYYCLHLATELFLKACIIRLGSEPSKVHEIADLRSQYAQLLPGNQYAFPTPWFLSAKQLHDLFGGEVLRGIDRTPDQLYRYGADKHGAPSEGTQLFTPGYLFNYMKHLESRWSEIWNDLNASDA